MSKDHLRVESYGTVDELNAALGVAREALSDPGLLEQLGMIQQDLFVLGASLATPGAEDGTAKPVTPDLPTHRIEEMEAWIDNAMEQTPKLRSFILPGGTRGASALHMARTICRRAERAVVRLTQVAGVEEGVVAYLNRLSDLLFSLARLENHRQGKGDVAWKKEDR